jgi:hypothetical protein
MPERTTMGLSWQQGTLGRDPNGRFLTPSPMSERLLFAESLRRRMSVELGAIRLPEDAPARVSE